MAFVLYCVALFKCMQYNTTPSGTQQEVQHMGMVRLCSRAHGFQICNGDCLHCSRYPDEWEEEMTQYASQKSKGRISLISFSREYPGQDVIKKPKEG